MLCQLLTSSSYRLGNIYGSNRTVKLTFLTCLSSDRHAKPIELTGPDFSLTHRIRLCLLKVRPATFEMGQVLFRSRYGLAPWDQIISTITRLDLDLLAEIAQIMDFFQEYYFHFQTS